jgi:hypothetical protein
MLPDILSQKVYLSAIVYLLLHLFVHLDKYSMTFLFGLTYYATLRLLTNLTITRTDILLPTIGHFIFPTMSSVFHESIAFLLFIAFSRMIVRE